MRFRTIEKRAEKFRQTGSDLAYRVYDLIGYAINNADDSIQEGYSESEYLKIAASSLEVLLAGCRDVEVTDWYRKQGFVW